ncbi:MAG TPA: hypothetical protein VK399_09600, partial [Longimicrobiaceae bacterium]|nr:hypothetical protein [Longimicrobiaceae bacterium]
MDGTLAISLLLVVTAVGVTLVMWSMHVEDERTRGLEEAAMGLGWSFAAKQPLDVIPGLERFGLFGQGRSRSITNFMAGHKDDVRAAVFDYQFTVGSGKSQSTVRQTVVYLRSAALGLPGFSVRPENVFHRIGSVFGYQDVDFPDRPEFSRRCLLRGPDEAALRAAFPAEVTGFFEGEAKWCADGEG